MEEHLWATTSIAACIKRFAETSVHLNSASQTNHINMLCDSIPVMALQHCPSLSTQAQKIAKKHRQGLLLFNAYHNIYVQNYVDTSEIEQLHK